MDAFKLKHTKLEDDKLKINGFINSKTLDITLGFPEACDGVNLLRKYENALRLYDLSCLFLGRHPVIYNDIDAIALLLLQDWFGHAIKNTRIKDGFALATVGKEEREWDLTAEKPFEVLLASYYIKEGYKIQLEDTGYRIIAPTGIERFTSLNRCDCEGIHSPCIHSALALQLHKHRANVLVKEFLKD